MRFRQSLVNVIPFLLPLHLYFTEAQKIAVIGGGVSGSFTAKYLADYDIECNIDVITIFDPFPPNGPINRKENVPNVEDWQGSRVACVQLEDGTFVEVGASIGYKGFHLVLEMLRADPSVQIGPPFNTGKQEISLPEGMGVYDGEGQWPLLTTIVPKALGKYLILGRYNWELLKLSRASQEAQKKFAEIPQLLQSNHPSTFYNSPDEIWEAVGLFNTVHSNFETLLDALGLKNELSGFRRLLPYQGSLRSELMTAVNLVNYNQKNAQVNGLVGLGSFAASSGGLFSIVGGNYKIIQSAMEQAMQIRETKCGDKKTMFQVEKPITTVLGNSNGFSLFAGDEHVGDFDVVVLAAPLQQAKIKFLIQSQMDEAVLLPMPLGGFLNPHDRPTEEGHAQIVDVLPKHAMRPYTQVVTTVVSNATLNASFFQLQDAYLPKSTLVTVKGKASLYNITGMTKISNNGVFKMFSDNPLDDQTLQTLFGSGYKKQFVKMWGGPHGGATPDYQGETFSTNFLLFDGQKNAVSPGALYYTATMEQSSLACMEMSALGARAVAKLVARRVGLIKNVTEEVRDEL